MAMWPAFALWIASAWERMPRKWRVTGASIIGLVGVILLLLACCWSDLFHHADGRVERERTTLHRLARA